jgi:hypothetical protein
VLRFASAVTLVVQVAALAVWIASQPGPLAAQNVSDFDPVATARLRVGEIVREIVASGRDPSASEPSQTDVFNTGLLLQAGLRALLPVSERRGVALPGSPSPSDPAPLVEAQENYKAVFESAAVATAAQRATALAALRTAAHQLSSEGYTTFSRKISQWLKSQ